MNKQIESIRDFIKENNSELNLYVGHIYKDERSTRMLYNSNIAEIIREYLISRLFTEFMRSNKLNNVKRSMQSNKLNKVKRSALEIDTANALLKFNHKTIYDKKKLTLILNDFKAIIQKYYFPNQENDFETKFKDIFSIETSFKIIKRHIDSEEPYTPWILKNACIVKNITEFENLLPIYSSVSKNNSQFLTGKYNLIAVNIPYAYDNNPLAKCKIITNNAYNVDPKITDDVIKKVFIPKLIASTTKKISVLQHFLYKLPDINQSLKVITPKKETVIITKKSIPEALDSNNNKIEILNIGFFDNNTNSYQIILNNVNKNKYTFINHRFTGEVVTNN